MAEPAFVCLDLDAVCLIDRLGLTVAGQHVGTDHTVLACRVAEPEEPGRTYGSPPVRDPVSV